MTLSSRLHDGHRCCFGFDPFLCQITPSLTIRSIQLPEDAFVSFELASPFLRSVPEPVLSALKILLKDKDTATLSDEEVNAVRQYLLSGAAMFSQ